LKTIIDYIEKNSIGIALLTLSFGIVVIFVFSFSSPFNDWSFQRDPELFGLYGNFIGGFVGTLFSLVAVLLLYKTLIAQQKSITKQDESLDNQKITSDIERFETTFFNLLKTQQSISSNIKTYFYSIKDNISTVTYTVQGSEFFAYSKSELSKIWNIIENKEFLGTFDEEYVPYIQHEIEQLYDPSNPKYTYEGDAKYEEQKIIKKEKLKLAIRQYNISKKYWEEIHKSEIQRKLEAMYGLFFQNYHYVIGHYYRHLYHIINFVKDFEESRSDFNGLSKKYIDFIQAQMSSFEMMLLFYNSISFPKLLTLLKKYNFLENLAIEDLIDESHNCIDGIKLKARKKLLG